MSWLASGLKYLNPLSPYSILFFGVCGSPDFLFTTRQHRNEGGGGGGGGGVEIKLPKCFNSFVQYCSFVWLACWFWICTQLVPKILSILQSLHRQISDISYGSALRHFKWYSYVYVLKFFTVFCLACSHCLFPHAASLLRRASFSGGRGGGGGGGGGGDEKSTRNEK